MSRPRRCNGGTLAPALLKPSYMPKQKYRPAGRKQPSGDRRPALHQGWTGSRNQDVINVHRIRAGRSRARREIPCREEVLNTRDGRDAGGDRGSRRWNIFITDGRPSPLSERSRRAIDAISIHDPKMLSGGAQRARQNERTWRAEWASRCDGFLARPAGSGETSKARPWGALLSGRFRRPASRPHAGGAAQPRCRRPANPARAPMPRRAREPGSGT
jgi:hypothetical protein